MVLSLIGEMMILGFTITALGLVVAARIRQIQAMMGLTQMVLMPLMFLSGALFPISGLPGWLHVAVRINPITYAVQPMRSSVFSHISASKAAVHRLNPPLTWFGTRVPTLAQLAVVVLAGVLFLWLAILEFDHAD